MDEIYVKKYSFRPHHCLLAVLVLTLIIGVTVITITTSKFESSSDVIQFDNATITFTISEKSLELVHVDNNNSDVIQFYNATITFATSEKIPEMVHIDNKNKMITEMPYYARRFCTEVLQGTNFSPTRTILVSNGFVDTVMTAYNSHHNLVLRPDDIWTAIMTQFSFYINKEAEKFRDKFVSHKGQKELEVRTVGTLRFVSYGYLTKLMSDKIGENLKDPEVKKWILPSFSTTTDDDLVTTGIVFMASMKKYFSYTAILDCGIPSVTLEGSLQDWEGVLERLEKLKEYELEWWYDLLKPIIQQFVKARMGNSEMDFWMKICSHHSVGSGQDYISGWITAFCVFDADGNKQGFDQDNIMHEDLEEEVTGPWPFIDINDIPPGTVEVNLKINDYGMIHYSVMFAGHMGQEILDDLKTLKPKTGWAICLTPSPEDVKRLEESRDSYSLESRKMYETSSEI